MYQIAFFVPEEHAEKVKEAMFETGAGKMGNYSHCSFESKGLGQFKALPGSQPFIGQMGQLETVNELKVEMICDEEFLASAIAAMKSSHPYETPAYYVTKLVGI